MRLIEAHFLLGAMFDDLAIEQNQNPCGESKERRKLVEGARRGDKDLESRKNEPCGEQQHTHAIFDSE